MTDSLAWGIIATGNIAKAFATGLAHSKTGKLVAVASRSLEKAQEFAETFDVPHAHGSYEELLNNPDVQAVYIATPHPSHAELSIKAAEAGKHILCEKPMSMNHAEAMAVCDAVERHGVFFMEAFMYRCHPQTTKLVELVRSHTIGDVRLVRAIFSFQSKFSPDSRTWKNALGGGGILDVGGYTMSMVRLVAGAATGQPFADPIKLVGTGVLHPETGVDAVACADLKFPGEILAQISAGVGLRQDNMVQIFGTEGLITVPTPWVPSRQSGRTVIRVEHYGGDTEEIAIDTDQWLYALEADTVASHLDAKQAPAMSHADSLGNMQALDQWRDAIGLKYENE